MLVLSSPCRRLPPSFMTANLSNNNKQPTLNGQNDQTDKRPTNNQYDCNKMIKILYNGILSLVWRSFVRSVPISLNSFSCWNICNKTNSFMVGVLLFVFNIFLIFFFFWTLQQHYYRTFGASWISQIYATMCRITTTLKSSSKC